MKIVDLLILTSKIQRVKSRLVLGRDSMEDETAIKRCYPSSLFCTVHCHDDTVLGKTSESKMSESQTSESKTSERKTSENYSFIKVIPINVLYQGNNREWAT